MYTHRRRFVASSRFPSTVPRIKIELFACHCGCGETFIARYRTNRPLYKNKTHKMRAYRARRRERELWLAQ